MPKQKKTNVSHMDLLLKVFRVIVLYSKRIRHNESVHLKIRSGYAIIKKTRRELFIAYINQSLTKPNANPTMNYYNPKNLICQYIPF